MIAVKPGQFGVMGGGLSAAPVHWWDLDDDGVWSDDVGSWALTEAGTVTVATGNGPGGQDTCNQTVGSTSRLDLASKNPTSEGFNGPWSFSIWANFASFNTGSNGNWVMNWRGSTGSTIFFQQMYSGTTFDQFYLTGPSAAPQIGSTITEATGTWYHFAGTSDGTTLEFWINGASQGTGTEGAVPNAVQPFCIGNGAWSATSFTNFYGYVAMAGLWTAQLTSDDIAYLYNSGSGRQYADL